MGRKCNRVGGSTESVISDIAIAVQLRQLSAEDGNTVSVIFLEADCIVPPFGEEGRLLPLRYLSSAGDFQIEAGVA